MIGQETRQDPVKIGLVGVGWWGGVLADAAGTTGLVNVAGCFARNPQQRAAFAETHSCQAFETLEDMLAADIDGVAVATPHSTHGDLALRAVEAGKHVFVDKPFTLTVTEATRVIDAARDVGVVVQVGHNRRRQPANRYIRKAIEGGDLGKVLGISSYHSAPLLFNPRLAPWRRRVEETPVGGLTALGIHQVDTFHYLCGDIAGVFTRSSRLLPDGDVDDTTNVVFDFISGVQGHLFMSQASGPEVEVNVNGTDAIARNMLDGERLLILKRGSDEYQEVSLEPLDTIADELVEFGLAIRGEREPETDGEIGRRAVAVMEAIVESAATNRWVEVSYRA